MRSRILTLTLFSMFFLAVGCPADKPAPGDESGGAAETPKADEAPKADAAPAPAVGVDTEKKILYIGALNDESGPAASIGKPFAVGKRVLAARVNAGGTGLLPAGWKIELVERDHGYNPQRAMQLYNEIKDKVLFVGTSFGTPNTLPLREVLKRDQLTAFPASLSSKMAEFEYTPPVGAPYSYEAARAVEWSVESAGGADKVKMGIVYQQDDYGQDGLDGLTKAAEALGVSVVSKQTVAPGQADYAAVVTGLKDAGATHVLLTTLPSATGPILGTAAQLGYAPTWIGNTPSWIDRFFDPKVIPAPVFGKFHWVTGLYYWGESGRGMDDFMAAYEAHGKELSPPDFYVMVSYAQGIVALEAFRRALREGDVSRAGYSKALRSMKDYDAGGLLRPSDLSAFPYRTSSEVRVLKPKMAERSWEVVGDWAAPTTMAAAK